MVRRVEKTVANHLRLQNSNEGNLVSDVANVDYLHGRLGLKGRHPEVNHYVYCKFNVIQPLGCKVVSNKLFI